MKERKMTLRRKILILFLVVLILLSSFVSAKIKMILRLSGRLEVAKLFDNATYLFLLFLIIPAIAFLGKEDKMFEDDFWGEILFVFNIMIFMELVYALMLYILIK